MIASIAKKKKKNGVPYKSGGCAFLFALCGSCTSVPSEMNPANLHVHKKEQLNFTRRGYIPDAKTFWCHPKWLKSSPTPRPPGAVVDSEPSCPRC